VRPPALRVIAVNSNSYKGTLSGSVSEFYSDPMLHRVLVILNECAVNDYVICCRTMVEETVSNFITMTCAVHPPSNWTIFNSLFTEAETHEIVLTITGSASKLYIDTMLPCIGDINFMIDFINKLVVPKGHHVTKHVQLPAEFNFRDEIKLYEFVDSQFPGYVFIRLIGTLNKCRVLRVCIND